MKEQEMRERWEDRAGRRSRFLGQVERYRAVFLRKWWALLSGIGFGAAAIVLAAQLQRPLFTAHGRMMVSMKLSLPEGSVYTEELVNFLGTQAALMQSSAVIERAHARARRRELSEATGTREQEQPSGGNDHASIISPQTIGHGKEAVRLKVSVIPKTTIFVLSATGGEARYTAAFLQAVMEEYIELKKEIRLATSDRTVAGLTEELLKVEKELRRAEEELTTFQGTNRVVLLQDQGNSVASYLAGLNVRLASVKWQHELLEALTLEQNLERGQEQAEIVATESRALAGSGADYLKAKQQVLLLKTERDEMGEYLRAKHPKMLALAEEIGRRERLLEILREQSAEQVASRKRTLALEVRKLEKEVKEWEARALEASRKSADFQRLKGNAQRAQGIYERLLGTLQALDVNREISQESVTILEKASEALPERAELGMQVAAGAAAGFAAALLILLFLDRMDDRMSSAREVEELFEEPVLAQIPHEKANRTGTVELIGEKDARHGFVEGYRSLRSALLFGDGQERRPKKLLVTSSVPEEGKSLTTTNLALTLARAGSRVLLVDADLRKGKLHQLLGIECAPGLTEVFVQKVNWWDTVSKTKDANLWLVPRGKGSEACGEFFLSGVMQKILVEAAGDYEFVVVDSAPVMAADDVTSLAPLLDGVVFVLRAEETSARIARAALDALYQRGVSVLGLVLNGVRRGSREYYCYEQYGAEYGGVDRVSE